MYLLTVIFHHDQSMIVNFHVACGGFVSLSMPQSIPPFFIQWLPKFITNRNLYIPSQTWQSPSRLVLKFLNAMHAFAHQLSCNFWPSFEGASANIRLPDANFLLP